MNTTIISIIGILFVSIIFIIINIKKDNLEIPTIEPTLENKKFIYNGKYVDECPSDKLYNDGEVCVDECPSERPYVIEKGCTSSCGEINRYLENDKICLSTCFPKYSDNTTNKCVVSCSKYTDENSRICYDNIPNNRFLFENKIVNSCASYYNKNTRECGLPKAEYLDGIIAGNKGEYISLIGKIDNNYYAFIFNDIKWYPIKLDGAINIPKIQSSADGKIQIITIPYQIRDDKELKSCLISRDYGNTFENFNFGYFLSYNIRNDGDNYLSEIIDLNLSYDGRYVSAISYYNNFYGSVVVLDPNTNVVKYRNEIFNSYLDKIEMTTFSNNIILLYNSFIKTGNIIHYEIMDTSLRETFDFDGDIFTKIEATEDSISYKQNIYEYDCCATILSNNSAYSFNYLTNYNNRNITNINNINSPITKFVTVDTLIDNYSITKNSDFLFVVETDKNLSIYNIQQDKIRLQFPKLSLAFLSKPKIICGKDSNNVYLIDIVNINKIYKLQIENNVSIYPLFNSYNIKYRHLYSNVENPNSILAIGGDNKLYISKDDGQSWGEIN